MYILNPAEPINIIRRNNVIETFSQIKDKNAYDTSIYQFNFYEMLQN